MTPAISYHEKVTSIVHASKHYPDSRIFCQVPSGNGTFGDLSDAQQLPGWMFQSHGSNETSTGLFGNRQYGHSQHLELLLWSSSKLPVLSKSALGDQFISRVKVQIHFCPRMETKIPMTLECLSLLGVLQGW